MGGNALSVESVRLNAANYKKLSNYCVTQLALNFPLGRFHAIESYGSKADHGDLDLLVYAPRYDPFLCASSLGATEVVRNGPVTSIGISSLQEFGLEEGDVFQVDLISIDADSFEYAANYFSFNDLGNLIGRTAHAMGVAHRHDGLYYYMRDGDYKFREILLTKNYDQALIFLGYDHERFSQGFETLNEIFMYVSGSDFFNTGIFLLENRNAKSRIRDRKRKTYMEFLDFCEKNSDLTGYEYPKEKSEWFSRIKEYFPHFDGEYKEAVAALQRQRILKSKFNGEMVSKLTGLQGKELGVFMKEFKNSFGSNEELGAFVLHSTVEEIKSRVNSFVESLRGFQKSDCG